MVTTTWTKCICCPAEGRMRKKLGGAQFGPSCKLHTGIAWLLDFCSVPGNATRYQMEVARWLQRRELVMSEGKPFNEAMPRSPAERSLENIIIEKGWANAVINGDVK